MAAVSAVVRADSGSGGPFDLINGIPLHPLVVHLAVVAVPAAAIGLLVMVVRPGFSRRYGGWVLGLAAVGLGAAFLAKESGERLEERVGEPGFNHAALGDVSKEELGHANLHTSNGAIDDAVENPDPRTLCQRAREQGSQGG